MIMITIITVKMIIITNDNDHNDRVKRASEGRGRVVAAERMTG